MNALASIWSWIAIVLVVFVNVFVQGALWLVTAPFDRRRLVAGRCFRIAAVVASKLIPNWHFSVEGPAPRGLRGKIVVVSNHESNADPFLLSFLPWEMKWLGKASLFKIPGFGWSMWMAGDIPVVRGESASAGVAMKRCAEWLARDMPVMIFPEGTRSKDGKLLPFKDGAFRLAVDTGAQVLPIALHGTCTALPKHSWRFARAPTRGRVMVGTPIASAGKTASELKAEALAQIEGLRAILQKE